MSWFELTLHAKRIVNITQAFGTAETAVSKYTHKKNGE